MGPSNESECPVEPVGVEIIIPSILWETCSFKRLILSDGVRVKFTLVITTSFNAGPSIFPSIWA